MNITSPIFKMFAKSPIRPLQEHMNKAYTCAATLFPFFTAVLADDWTKAAEEHKNIVALEKEADQLKRDLRLNLPKGLFLPVHRGDILDLVSMQDHVANKAKDIAGLILGRQMKLPEAIANDFMPFLQRCIDATQQACIAINELDELLEAGFSGNEVKLVEKMILKLDEIEHDTDDMQVEIRKKLFFLEATLPPIDVMFLYQIIEWTGELADDAEIVGGRLQLLLAS